MPQVVECLPSKHEALRAKLQKERENKRERERAARGDVSLRSPMTHFLCRLDR
jgi:hypothetical protein